MKQKPSNASFMISQIVLVCVLSSARSECAVKLKNWSLRLLKFSLAVCVCYFSLFPLFFDRTVWQFSLELRIGCQRSRRESFCSSCALESHTHSAQWDGRKNTLPPVPRRVFHRFPAARSRSRIDHIMQDGNRRVCVCLVSAESGGASPLFHPNNGRSPSFNSHPSAPASGRAPARTCHVHVGKVSRARARRECERRTVSLFISDLLVHGVPELGSAVWDRGSL